MKFSLPSKLNSIAFLLAGTSFLLMPDLRAADYTYTAATNNNWNNTANWTPAGTPGGADNIVSQSGGSLLNLNGAARNITNFNLDRAANFDVLANTSANGTLTISGTLTNSGAGTAHTFRNGTLLLDVSVANVVVDSGLLNFGTSANVLNNLSISTGITVNNSGTVGMSVTNTAVSLGLVTVNTGGALTFANGGVTGTRGFTANGLAGTGGTISGATNSANVQLTISNSATADSNSVIGDGTSTGILSVIKQGSGIQKLSGANTYSGGTAINAGTLLVNNVSGSGLGTGAVTVNNTGTLGGTGRIAMSGANDLQITSGGVLAPGDGGIESLEINLGSTTGTADFASDSTFVFDLNAPGISDVLSFTGLTASSGDVTFNSTTVNFTNLGGLAAGTYTLFTFDASNAYTGTLTVGSGLGSFSGNFIYNADSIQLNVVPEPQTWALVGIGLAFTCHRLRRKTGQ